ncbi:glycoside hydrolase family 68 protein, partial [Pseudomonas coronafaciens]
DKGVELKDFTDVKILFDADGTYYQTEAQNSTWNFRDPSPFIDPNDGKLYMVFEGNVAGERGSHTVGVAELGPVPPG